MPTPTMQILQLSVFLPCILCFCFCLEHNGGVESKRFFVPTAQLFGGTKLKTCYYVASLSISDLKAGKPVNDKPEKYIATSKVLNTARGGETKSSVLHRVGCHKNNDTHIGDDEKGRVLMSRVTYDLGSGFIGLDSFSPVPAQRLASKYIIMAGDASFGAQPYFSVINTLREKTIEVTVDPGPRLTLQDFVSESNPAAIEDGRVTVPSRSTKSFVLRTKNVYGVTLTGTDVFGVLAGSFTTPKNPQDVLHAIEMFPPECFYGNDYVIPFDAKIFTVVTIKIQALLNDTHIFVLDGKPGINYFKQKHTLSRAGDHVSVDHDQVLRISGSKAFIAVQYFYKHYLTAPSAMTLIPPVVRWKKTTVLFPLTTPTDTATKHYATVISQSHHANQVRAFNIVTGQIAPLVFTGQQYLGVSVAHISLSETDILAMTHTDGFIIIQYGMLKDTVKYASPVFSNWEDCRESQNIAGSIPFYDPQRNDKKTLNIKNVKYDEEIKTKEMYKVRSELFLEKIKQFLLLVLFLVVLVLVAIFVYPALKKCIILHYQRLSKDNPRIIRKENENPSEIQTENKETESIKGESTINIKAQNTTVVEKTSHAVKSSSGKSTEEDDWSPQTDTEPSRTEPVTSPDTD